MEITKNSIIGDVLDQHPDIEEACYVHGADADKLVEALNAAV